MLKRLVFDNDNDNLFKNDEEITKLVNDIVACADKVYEDDEDDEDDEGDDPLDALYELFNEVSSLMTPSPNGKSFIDDDVVDNLDLGFRLCQLAAGDDVYIVTDVIIPSVNCYDLYFVGTKDEVIASLKPALEKARSLLS